MYREDPHKYVQYMIFDSDNLENIWLCEFINNSNQIGFFMAYYTDAMKSLWQNQMFLDQYIKRKRPFKHLKFKMYWDQY